MEYARTTGIAVFTVGWSIILIKYSNDLIGKLKKYKYERDLDRDFKNFKYRLDELVKSRECKFETPRQWSVVSEKKNLG